MCEIWPKEPASDEITNNRPCQSTHRDGSSEEDRFYVNAGGVIVYVEVVEIDEFVIVEAGVLLLDSILLVLQGPLPLEGAGLDFLDPLGVLPKRPLFEVEVDDPLMLRLAPCPNLPPSSPFSPFPRGSMGLEGSGH